MRSFTNCAVRRLVRVRGDWLHLRTSVRRGDDIAWILASVVKTIGTSIAQGPQALQGRMSEGRAMQLCIWLGSSSRLRSPMGSRLTRPHRKGDRRHEAPRLKARVQGSGPPRLQSGRPRRQPRTMPDRTRTHRAALPTSCFHSVSTAPGRSGRRNSPRFGLSRRRWRSFASRAPTA